jgi:hypothetical protein
MDGVAPAFVDCFAHALAGILENTILQIGQKGIQWIAHYHSLRTGSGNTRSKKKITRRQSVFPDRRFDRFIPREKARRGDPQRAFSLLR